MRLVRIDRSDLQIFGKIVQFILLLGLEQNVVLGLENVKAVVDETALDVRFERPVQLHEQSDLLRRDDHHVLGRLFGQFHNPALDFHRLQLQILRSTEQIEVLQIKVQVGVVDANEAGLQAITAGFAQSFGEVGEALLQYGQLVQLPLLREGGRRLWFQVSVLASVDYDVDLDFLDLSQTVVDQRNHQTAVLLVIG